MDQNMMQSAGEYEYDSKSPDLGDGRVYKILKSDALKASESGTTLYFKFEEKEEYRDILVYRGYSNMIKKDDKVIGLTAGYYVSPITHVLFENKKVLRIYLSDKAFNSDITGDLIEVYNTAYVNGNQVVKSYLGAVSKDALGEYYVEVPTNEAAFAAIALTGYGTVKKYGEEGYGWSFSVKNNATIPVLTNLTVKSGTWTLLYPDMRVANSGDAGTNLLGAKDLLGYSKQAYMILEETVDGKTTTTQVIFKAAAADVDKIIYYNGDESWTAELAKEEGITLETPESPIGDSEWKNNHTFAGWYLKSDTNHTNKIESIIAEGGKTVELVAYWKPKTYKVIIQKINDQEESENIKEFDLLYDGRIALNSDTTGAEQREGYTLCFGKADNKCLPEGEFTYEDCSEYYHHENEGTLYLMTVYKPKDYKIYFHKNGVDVTGLATSLGFNVNSEEYQLPNLNEETYNASYEFLGWYKDSDFKESITSVEKGHVGNVHVYAKWAPKSYTLKFDSNLEYYSDLEFAKTTVISDVTYNIGEVVTLPATTYSVKPKDSSDNSKWAFVGWTTTKNVDGSSVYYGPKEKIFFDEADEDNIVTLYAQYQATTVIDYDLDGGSMPEDTKYEHVIGTKAYSLPAPVKPGYDFLGWYELTNSGTGKKITSVSDKNTGIVRVKAIWNERTYKVTLNPNGGKGKTVTLSLGYEGSLDLSEYTDYTKVGFYFDGFALSDDMETELYCLTPKEIDSMGSLKNGSKIVLKARWILDDYTITYDTNGGTISSNTQPYQYALVNTPKLKVPVKEGYTFAGWYFDEDLKKSAGSFKNGEQYLAKATTGNITLYAKWTCDYTLVLHVDDTDTSKVETFTGYKYETAKAIATPKFKKAGMTLVGWHIEDSEDKKYDAKEKIAGISPTDGKVHLYAIWKSNKYTINYYNSAYGYSSKSQTANAGKQVTLIKNPYTRYGYTLMGWTTDSASQEVEYANGAKVDLTMKAQSDVVKLYPIWRNTFEITFDGNDSVAHVYRESYTYTYGHEIKEKSFALISNPSKCGYVFSGWYTDKTCKKAFKKISATQSGDFTLYAKWVPLTYNITFDANAPAGAKVTGKMRTQKLTYDKYTGLTKNAYKIAGYRFAGWDTMPNTSEPLYSDCQKILCLTEDCEPDNTLYAIWEPIEYTITYMNVSEYGIDIANNAELPKTYKISNKDIEIKEVEKLGYVFKGWYSDKAMRKPVSGIKAGTSGNITLYAKWEKLK